MHKNSVPSTIGTVNYLVFERFGVPCGKVFDTFVICQPISHNYPSSYRIVAVKATGSKVYCGIRDTVESLLHELKH
jgi:hypothetical protein